MPWNARPFAFIMTCPWLIALEGEEEEEEEEEGEEAMVPMLQQPEEAKWTMQWRRATRTTSTTVRQLPTSNQSWRTL
jgi:hypothetical protein